MNVDIARAWRDQDYFASLTADQQALVPENPAGMVDLSMTDLQQVAGARAAASCTGSSCCSCAKSCGSASLAPAPAAS